MDIGENSDKKTIRLVATHIRRGVFESSPKMIRILSLVFPSSVYQASPKIKADLQFHVRNENLDSRQNRCVASMNRPQRD